MAAVQQVECASKEEIKTSRNSGRAEQKIANSFRKRGKSCYGKEAQGDKEMQSAVSAAHVWKQRTANPNRRNKGYDNESSGDLANSMQATCGIRAQSSLQAEVSNSDQLAL